MADYLANQIILEKLDYTVVVTKKHELRAEIDTYLTAQSRSDLITQ